MDFKNLEIRKRLQLGFGFLTIAFILVSVLSIVKMNNLADLTNQLYLSPYTVTKLVINIKADLNIIRSNMREIVLAESASDVESLRSANTNLETRMLDNYNIVQKRFWGDQTFITNSRTAYMQYKAVREEVGNLMVKQDSASKAAARNLFKTKGKESFIASVQAVEQLENFALNKATDFYEDAKSQRNSALTMSITSMILALIVIVFLSLNISKSITKPIEEITDISNKMAQGDLNIQFKIQGENEITDLMQSMQSIVNKFKEVISSIVHASANFVNSSHQISMSSQQLSNGASSQASSLEELSAAIEQMTANINQNTHNSKQTEKIAQKASDEIIKGSNSVNETVNSMKKIAGKVSIISEIAFQTNILALNAAVEAARAGEFGKGFAVVAAEVRKLAEKSQKEAKEITELTQRSVEIAVQTGNLFLEIVPTIQHTAQLVQEITASSIEQDAGTKQISNAIDTLNQIAQQNAAASEEFATSSEEMNSQAEQMQELVDFFKV